MINWIQNHLLVIGMAYILIEALIYAWKGWRSDNMGIEGTTEEVAGNNDSHRPKLSRRKE